VSTKTVHATLDKDLQLSNKSAMLVTKLLYKEMRKEQVRTCEVFVVIITAAPSPSWTTSSLLVSPPGVEERPGQPHPHPGASYVEGAGGCR
jgi:hypothetical protein